MIALDRRSWLTRGAALIGAAAVAPRAFAEPAGERFEIAIPQARLDRIRRQIADHQWGPAPESGGWSYGVDQAYLRRLVAYWLNGYDWRRTEARMNARVQRLVTIDGGRLHYMLQESTAPTRLPLLLVHGWPYSFWSFEEVAPKLAAPGAGGVGFDVVMPSIPGFDFSDAPANPTGLRALSGRLHKLMTETLGHRRYVVAGGDFGAVIGTWLAFDHPESVVGLWQDMPAQLHYGTAFTEATPVKPTSDAEAKYDAENAGRFFREFGYFHLQVTRPTLLGESLADNPVGQAAWIVEKHHAWTALAGRRFADVWSFDALLDTVMLYTATNSFSTAVWPYRGFTLPGEAPQLPPERRIEVPVAIASGNDPLSPMPPREVMALSRANIVQWTAFNGGHFLFRENPDAYVADIQAFGRKLRA